MHHAVAGNTLARDKSIEEATTMREETERQFRQLLGQHDREFLKSVTPRLSAC